MGLTSQRGRGLQVYQRVQIILFLHRVGTKHRGRLSPKWIFILQASSSKAFPSKVDFIFCILEWVEWSITVSSCLRQSLAIVISHFGTHLLVLAQRRSCIQISWSHILLHADQNSDSTPVPVSMIDHSIFLNVVLHKLVLMILYFNGTSGLALLLSSEPTLSLVVVGLIQPVLFTITLEEPSLSISHLTV